MGIFKPNVEKMRKKKDVEGLIEALKHRDSRLRHSVAVALGRIGKPAVNACMGSLVVGQI